MDYNKTISKVMPLIGGKTNISSHTTCITRLRISLKDTAVVNTDELKSLDGILGVNFNNEELQLIFGPGKVKKAHTALISFLDSDKTSDDQPQTNSNDSFDDVIQSQKKNVKSKRTSTFQGFMSNFSNIFVPLIPGFIAAGILAGISGLCKELGIEGDFLNYLNVFNKSLMQFMYIMIGFNATKAFGGTPVIGGILAGLFLMSYGDGGNSGMVDFLGFAIDPRGGMIGILFTSILSAKVEILIRKYFSWDAIDIITTPILTLLVMGAFTFIVIMPLSYQLFLGMNFLFATLNTNPIGTGVLAGLFLPSVMMGIHQGFVPVYQGLVETTGMNSLFPILAMAGAGQVGASLALYVKAPKDSNLRKNIRGAIIPGFLGIGEPLIYGITLPRVKPFFTSMAGGAVGGIYVGVLAQLGFTFGLNTVFGSSGLLGSFAMTSNKGVVTGILLYLSALIVAYIGGFVFTILFGTKGVDLS